MQHSGWQIGEQVTVRGSRWRIRGAEVWPDCTLLRLAAVGDAHGVCSLLSPFDRPARPCVARGARVVRARRWLHDARRLDASLVPFGGARVAADAAIRLIPYQFEPMLAILRDGASRVLIADAVGLGKTIQAGLVASELAEREPSFRGLLIVPAGLRHQWTEELEHHFRLATLQADAAWLREAERSQPPDVNPWSLPGLYVCSIDFAKRPEVLRSLEEVTWTLMVLDEAHVASSTSDRRAAAHALACRARHVLLLTATPDAGDPARFGSLTSIGRLEQDEPITCFRRTRAEIGDGPRRRSTLLFVKPTVAERRMHALLDRYTRRVWKEASARQDTRGRLAAIVLHKRALSSPSSLVLSARRRLELLAGAPAERDEQMLLPFGEEDPLHDRVQDHELAAPGLADGPLESRLLDAIVKSAGRAAGSESKVRTLARFLARVREPVLIFTEYRDTLAHLERMVLATGREVLTLHGGMDRRARAGVQQRFNCGGVSLIATDAASEGLNLHRHCRVVVHFELPWRPARIEQRAGRVDRLGQTRRVHEIALVSSGTSERLVLAPLMRRAVEARAAGEAGGLADSLAESMVAAAILERDRGAPETMGIPGPARVLGADHAIAGAAAGSRTFVPADLRRAAEAEVGRLERVRISAKRSASRGRPDIGPWIGSVRHAAGLPRGLTLVFRLTVSDSNGRVEHQESLVLSTVLPVRPAELRSASRLRVFFEQLGAGWLERHGPHPRVLREAEESMLATVLQARGRRLEARGRRLRLMAASQPSTSRRMVQAGLFDSRALRRRARDDAARAVRLGSLVHEGEALGESAPPVARVELMAALVAERSRG